MANQNATQDDNLFPAMIAHAGTAGTAETVKVVANAAGAITVDIGGTEPFELVAGTVTRVSTIGTLEAGTIATNLLPLGGLVLTTATGVGTTAGSIPATALANRKAIICYNNGTSPIYLGGSGVTTVNGLPLGTADYSPSFDLGTTVLFGIASTAGGTVISLEVS